MIEVMVIGSGPAGLSAALTLGRARRSTMLLDFGAPRNARAHAVHNMFTRDGTPPAELRQIGFDQLASYPTVEVWKVAADRIELGADGGFNVTLADNETVSVRRVLLATGIRDELPPIEGLAELWGSSVFACPYCHGYEVRDQRLVVLGATDQMIDLAFHLRRFSRDVVLCTNGEFGIDGHHRDLLNQQGIDVETEVIARLDASGDSLRAIVFADGRELERDAMFAVGIPRQRSELAAQLGCNLLQDGSIKVSEFGQTTVPGVYAVGDMARRVNMPTLSAVIAASASGTLTGAVIDKDLLASDLGLPNPFAARSSS